MLTVALPLITCSGKRDEATPPASASKETATAPAESAAQQKSDELPPPPAFVSGLPEQVQKLVRVSFTGDLDEMVKRRVIRVGLTANRTHYFVDKGVQRGITYEYLMKFEEELNKKLKTGNLKVNVVFVPLPRDLLGGALTSGKVDLVAAQVTITPERQKVVDFTTPVRTDVNEIVVSGPGVPPIAKFEDLAGRQIFVRKGSVQQESLVAISKTLKSQGKAAVDTREVPANLEDDDLLEMVSAGLIPATVVDDFMAQFWKSVFTNLTVNEAVPVRTGGSLAVAIRKNSPKLAAELNAFIAAYGKGSTFGNIMQKRYLESTKYAKNATSEEDRKRFRAMIELFRKYSGQYKLDYILMAAQAYQESGLDQNRKSAVGAIGVMQVMPATGAELKVGDIQKLEPNIHAGVKYIRFMIDQYYKDEPMDALNKGLFTFASYNAGPARIRKLREEAAKRGLDPNVWFGNVETVASERIGRETVTYVSNIYKYYVAYKIMVEQNQSRNQTKRALKAGSTQ